MQEMQILSLGREDPQEKEMATQSRILAWEIPWIAYWATVHGTGCDLATKQQQHNTNEDDCHFLVVGEVGILFCCIVLLSPMKFHKKRSPYNLLHTKKTDGEGNGTPLQYSCLENPTDKGAW